jgi:endonuclease YncB( thermonuclease family)
MNMPRIPARTRKFIGVGILAASLLSAATGCAAGDNKDAAAAAPAATVSATPSAAQPASLRGKLVRVVSGDTVELLPVSDKNGEPTGEPNVTVHILGIKAPAADACGGPEAAAELKRIINSNGFFRVKYDDQSARVDSAGNAQGYLISGDGSGVPMDVGSSMVENGFASAWYDSADHAPKSYAADSAATKTAQAQKTGIWASCPVPTV